MTAKTIVVALVLLLTAASFALAQGNGSQAPGPYYGNDYGPDRGDAAAPGSASQPSR